MEIQEFLEAKKKEFLEVLKKNNFNLEAPEVIQALEVVKAFEIPVPVIQEFEAPNGLIIRLRLKYPCPYKTYPLKVGYFPHRPEKPITVKLYNTFSFKLL